MERLKNLIAQAYDSLIALEKCLDDLQDDPKSEDLIVLCLGFSALTQKHIEESSQLTPNNVRVLLLRAQPIINHITFDLSLLYRGVVRGLEDKFFILVETLIDISKIVKDLISEALRELGGD